jgi:hypothetical protein
MDEEDTRKKKLSQPEPLLIHKFSAKITSKQQCAGDFGFGVVEEAKKSRRKGGEKCAREKETIILYNMKDVHCLVLEALSRPGRECDGERARLNNK